MKNKSFIIVIAIIAIAVVLIIFSVFFNKKNKSEITKEVDISFFEDLGENQQYAKLYLEFLKSTEFKNNLENEMMISLTFIDLDFDKVPELIITNNEVIEKIDNIGSNHKYIIYAIKNSAVEKINEFKIDNISLYYHEDNNRCYWAYQTVNMETKKLDYYQIGDVEKPTYVPTPNSKRIGNKKFVSVFMPISDENLIEKIKEAFNNNINFENGFTQEEMNLTYEIASNENIPTDSNTENEFTIEKQKLSEVVNIGDYVNYLGSSTDWRVLNTGDTGVTLISAKGVKKYSTITGGEMYNLAVTNANEYYSEYTKVATEIPTFDAISASYQKTHSKKIEYNSKLEGDLYVIGQDYYIPSGDSKDIDSPNIWITENGTVKRTFTEIEAYSRPVITLKEDVLTSGKDQNNSWILTY